MTQLLQGRITIAKVLKSMANDIPAIAQKLAWISIPKGKDHTQFHHHKELSFQFTINSFDKKTEQLFIYHPESKLGASYPLKGKNYEALSKLLKSIINDEHII
jgi:hypothetical protein